MSDVPSDPEVLVNVAAPLAWVAVNRPAARNALNVAVWRALATQMAALASDPQVRVIILRGSGDEAFMAGADINEFPAMRADAAMTAQYDQHSHAALAAITTMEKPVIAMVNGLCFGGGCAVALACDLRFAADHARFAIPAVKLGLAYPQHAVEHLVHLVGPGHAADLLLSGRAVAADEGLRMGLVNRALPRAELESATRDYALRLAEGAPLTLAAHKAAIHVATGHAAEPDRARLRRLVERCFDSADYREGVAAFLEKRRPAFTGK